MPPFSAISTNSSPIAGEDHAEELAGVLPEPDVQSVEGHLGFVAPPRIDDDRRHEHDLKAGDEDQQQSELLDIVQSRGRDHSAPAEEVDPLGPRKHAAPHPVAEARPGRQSLELRQPFGDFVLLGLRLPAEEVDADPDEDRGEHQREPDRHHELVRAGRWRGDRCDEDGDGAEDEPPRRVAGDVAAGVAEGPVGTQQDDHVGGPCRQERAGDQEREELEERLPDGLPHP